MPRTLTDERSILGTVVRQAGRTIRTVRDYRKWPAWYETYRGWPLCILHSLGLLRAPAVVMALRNDLRFRLRPGTWDFNVLDEVWVRRVYPLQKLGVPADATIVDIGANIGAFSVMAARAVPRGRVLAFEPEPGNYRQLRSNLEINELGNVEAYCQGVAGQAGDRELCGLWSNAGLFNPNKHIAVRIACTTLAEIFERHAVDRVYALKCDCEGAEYEIFLGAPAGLLSRIDHILMEYHGTAEIPHRPADLAAHLESVGFKVRREGDDRSGMLYADNSRIETRSA